MNKNTGSRTVETTTFVYYRAGLETASHTWGPEHVARLDENLGSYERTHLSMYLDADGYRLDVQVWEYELPGLRVLAYVTDGVVELVISVSDDTATRLHSAVRRAQPVTVTYVKADGEETVRTIEPTGLSLTKAGDVIVKAADRKSGEKRSFRLDRVLAYTLHRTAFTVRTGTPAPHKADLVAAFRQAGPFTVEYRDHAKGERVLFESDDLIVADIVRGDVAVNPYRTLISTNF